MAITVSNLEKVLTSLDDIRPPFKISDTINGVPITITVDWESNFSITNIRTNESIDYLAFYGAHTKNDMKTLLHLVHVSVTKDVSKQELNDLFKRTWSSIYQKIYNRLSIEDLARSDIIGDIWSKNGYNVEQAIAAYESIPEKEKKKAYKKAENARKKFAERYLL